jgi:hypothetical protein
MSKGFSPEEYMKKLGWEAGKGLGKDLQGMEDPIRAVKKDGNSGLGGKGYDIQDFAFWDNIYAKASNNIQIQSTENGVMIKSGEKIEVKIPIQYQGSFIKSAAPSKSNDPFNENDLISRCLTQQHKKSKGKDKRLQNFESDGHSLRDVPVTTPPLSVLIELEKKKIAKELKKSKKRAREENEEEVREIEEKKDKHEDKKKDKKVKSDKSSKKKKDKSGKSSDKKKDKKDKKIKDKNNKGEPERKKQKSSK